MRWALLLVLLLIPGVARAQQAVPWTRDEGHFYVNLNYAHISSGNYHGLDYTSFPQNPGRFTIHDVGLYGEIGIVSRWLTATIEWELYRRGELAGLGYTEGLGDLRLGGWTGLLTRPLRLSLGIIAGVPTGDPQPGGGLPQSADAGARTIANSLPTGTGEFNFQAVVALGYSFGGYRRWPLLHYVVGSLGYWLHTAGFSDAVTYKAELGIKFPWRVIDHFWFIARLYGVQAFSAPAPVYPLAANTGLLSGSTYDSYGFQAAARIVKGLGAFLDWSTAYRARLEPGASAIRVGLSYEY